LAVLVEDTPRARRMSLHRAMRSRPKPVIESTISKKGRRFGPDPADMVNAGDGKH
jgi:hypothetical protein